MAKARGRSFPTRAWGLISKCVSAVGGYLSSRFPWPGYTEVDPFVAHDSFLRRVGRKGDIKNGIIALAVFKDKHVTLSFTYQDDDLRTENAVSQYQLDKVLGSGDLPGLCRLTFRDLAVEVQPALPPRFVCDPDDEKYGHLHCCTSQPSDREQQMKMAKLATLNGIVREFVPKKKRKDTVG